jgi:hypothetical protein
MGLVLIVLASVIGLALLLGSLTRRDLGLCLFVTVPGIVAILYLGALAGLLRPTAVTLFYAGLAACPIAIAVAVLQKRFLSLVADTLSPGPVILVAAAIIYWAVYRDATLLVWDEFNNWGFAAKEMFFTNGLPDGGTGNAFQDYPRATALFQYFFVRNTYWSEGGVLFAHFILSMAPLVVLFRNYRWKQMHWVALTLVFALLMCYTAGRWPRVILVDFALAAYFGVALIVYFSSEAESSVLAMLVPALFIMPLVKTPGFGFAMVCVAIIAADLTLRRIVGGRTLWGAVAGAGRAAWRLATRADILRAFPAATAWTRRLPGATAARGPHWVRRAALVALIVAAPLAAHWSWQIWVAETGLRRSHEFGHNRSYASVLRSFGAKGDPREVATRRAFVEALVSKPIAVLKKDTIYQSFRRSSPLLQKAPELGRLTTAGYALVALALFAAAFWMMPSPGARIRLVACVTILFAGFAAYLACLLADYLMGIHPKQGQALIQFHRYVWGYLMAVVLLAWAVVAGTVRRQDSTWPRRTAVPFVILLVFTAYLHIFENPRYTIIPAEGSPDGQQADPDWGELRRTLAPRVEFTRGIVEPDDDIYIVQRCGDALTSENFHTWICRFMFAGYEFCPLRTNLVCWTEKKPDCPCDPLAFGISPRRWERMLTRFSYVFIMRSDERFWKVYGGLFEPSGQRDETAFLFRVSYKASGHLVLIPVRMSGAAGLRLTRTSAAGKPLDVSARTE